MITYYDLCSECCSDHITYTPDRFTEDLLNFICHTCGIEWTDYASDLYNEQTQTAPII